jgi:hypothetical protein
MPCFCFVLIVTVDVPPLLSCGAVNEKMMARGGGEHQFNVKDRSGRWHVSLPSP